MVQENYKILVLLVVLATIRGIIYISIVPPWLAPDEATHFEAIRLIGQEKLWPTKDVYLTTPMHPEMHASFEKFRVWQISNLAPPQGDSSNVPYIYYYPARNSGSAVVIGEYPLIYHFLLSPVSALSSSLDIVQQLYLLRFFSLLFTIFTIVVGWLVARTIFPQQELYAVALCSFLIFLPMHTHINTSVNSDVLATFSVSLYFLALVKVFSDRPSYLWVVLGGVFFIVSILIKPTALFIIPTSVVAVIIYFTHHFEKRRYLLISLLAVITLMVFLGSIILFHFSNGGRNIFSPSLSTNNVNLSVNPFSPDAIAVYIYTLRFGFLSFWGLFGWANIPTLFPWLRVLQGICLLIALGINIFLVKHVFNWKGRNNSLQPYQKNILIVLLFSIIFALIGMYTPIIATQSIRWGPQSRYIFPALIPISLYFFLGFRQLFPAKIYHLALPIWVISLITFDTLTLGYVLIPHIYG